MSERLSGYAFTLIGVSELVSSIGLIYLLITIGSLLEMVGGYSYPYGYGYVQAPISLIVAGWLFTLLVLVTGFVALSAGISILTKPKEQPT